MCTYQSILLKEKSNNGILLNGVNNKTDILENAPLMERCKYEICGKYDLVVIYRKYDQINILNQDKC